MSRAPLVFCALLAGACASRAQTPPRPATPPATSGVRALGGLAAQRVTVTPVFAVATGDPLGWAATIARPRAMLRSLDSAIVAEFDARGMRSKWFFPPDLDRSYQVNPTYSPDPHALAEEPLRGKPALDKPYPDPLASQLRTLVALHDGARLVLLPVELRFEQHGKGPNGRAVLSLVLVDARAVEVRWTGKVESDPAPALGPAVIASLVAHFADMVISP